MREFSECNSSNDPTVVQPEKDFLCEPEIQPNLPENCQISALFNLQNPTNLIFE